MKLVKVIIQRYKSISQPIEIDLNKNLLTIIGKNGCGKTNVLNALKRALSKNYEYMYRDKEELDVDYIFELTSQEIEKYFYAVDITLTDKMITVHYKNNKPQVRMVEAPIVNLCVKEYRERMQKIYDDFCNSSKEYIDCLRLIEEKDYNSLKYIDCKVKTDRGQLYTLYSERIDWLENELKRQSNEIAKVLGQFNDNYIEITQNSYIPDFYILSNTITYYELDEQEISISPIVAESFNLDARAVEQANRKLNDKIKEVNKKLKYSFSNIQNAIDAFEQLKEEIARIFSTKSDLAFDTEHKYSESYSQFMQLLKDSIFGNGYYIDNENSLLFYRKEDDYQKNLKIKEYLNLDNPILGAFDAFLRSCKFYKQNETIYEFNKLDENRKKALVNKLNKGFVSKIVPYFEREEITNYYVKANGDQLLLFVREKNGQEINLEKTSLGRRWYLTYKLIASLLNEGDYLFIDEPAAFLHPQAQVEILKEIELFSQRGVHIFMSTHSPYMIPKNWDSIVSLTISKQGTQAKRFSTDDELAREIKQSIGNIRCTDILFNLSKTILLVEGIADKICIEKIAEIFNYDLRCFYIMPCNGSPIFDVTYLCISQQIKFKALFDLDNKQKPDKWMDKKYGYKEYLKIFETNPNCVFTPEIKKKKSLEDCFGELDNERYFFDYIWNDKKGGEHIERKIDKDKIIEALEFDEETKNNFEQLFKELGIPKLD